MLHRRLKARAAAQGRSMNALVTDLLRDGLGATDARAVLRLRLEAQDLRVIPKMERRAPTRDAAIGATRGAGRAASEALAAERAAR